MRNCKWCRVRLSSVLSSSYWSLRSLYNFISNAELLRKHTSAFHRILSWHQEMMKRDQEKHKMYFPSLCLENFYFYGLGCLHPRRPRGQIVGARESLNGRKNKARRKVKNGEKTQKSPWGQWLRRPVPNGRRRSDFWLVPEYLSLSNSFCIFGCSCARTNKKYYPTR